MYGTVPYGTVWYGIVRYGKVRRYCTILYDTVPYGMEHSPYGMVRYRTENLEILERREVDPI